MTEAETETVDAMTGEQEPVAWQWLVSGDVWTPCEPPSEDELKAMPHKFRPLYLGRMPAPACHDSQNSAEGDPPVRLDCAGAGSSLTEVQALHREIIDRQAEIQRLRGHAPRPDLPVDWVKDLLNLYFAPWGAANDARFEAMTGDALFDPEVVLKLIHEKLASPDTSTLGNSK